MSGRLPRADGDVPAARPAAVNWSTVTATMCGVVTTFLAVGGLLYAMGWNNQATVSQIAALNTLISTTTESNKTANEITKSDVAAVNARLTNLQDEIKQRRADDTADAAKQHDELMRRLDQNDRRADELGNQITGIKMSIERLAASYCFLSKQYAPTRNTDCTRGMP
jgi:hypothetical protein